MASPVKERCFRSPAGKAVTVESSYCNPPEEKSARWWLSVPAPTEITQGATELGPIDISVDSLPAANTTTMPASCAALVAWLMGSLGSKSENEEPNELLTTRMSQSARCLIRSSYATIALNT